MAGPVAMPYGIPNQYRRQKQRLSEQLAPRPVALTTQAGINSQVGPILDAGGVKEPTGQPRPHPRDLPHPFEDEENNPPGATVKPIGTYAQNRRKANQDWHQKHGYTAPQRPAFSANVFEMEGGVEPTIGYNQFGHKVPGVPGIQNGVKPIRRFSPKPGLGIPAATVDAPPGEIDPHDTSLTRQIAPAGATVGPSAVPTDNRFSDTFMPAPANLSQGRSLGKLPPGGINTQTLGGRQTGSTPGLYLDDTGNVRPEFGSTDPAKFGQGQVMQPAVGGAARTPTQVAQSPLTPPPGPQAGKWGGPSPGALALAQRSEIPADQLTGSALRMAEGLAARRGAPRTSDQFRLQTGPQSTLAGTTPNVTASPGFGGPQPGKPSAVTQQLGKPAAAPVVAQSNFPEMFAENGRPMQSLDDRVAAARGRMPGRPAPTSVADRLEPSATMPVSIPAPPLPPAPVTEPDAAERARDKARTLPRPKDTTPAGTPVFSGGASAANGPPQQPTQFSGGASTLPGDEELPPDAYEREMDKKRTRPSDQFLPKPSPATSDSPPRTDFTRFTPPTQPPIPAPVLRGPMTPPVQANRQRYADELERRRLAAGLRGMERGAERDTRLAARDAGVPYGAISARNMERQRLSDEFALKNRQLGIGEEDIASKERIEGGRTGADRFKTETGAEVARGSNASREKIAETEGRYGVEAAKARAGDMTRGDAGVVEGYQQQQMAWEGMAQKMDELGQTDKAKYYRQKGDEAGNMAKQAARVGGVAGQFMPQQAQQVNAPSEPDTSKMPLKPEEAKKQAESRGFDLKAVDDLVSSYGSMSPGEAGEEPGYGPMTGRGFAAAVMQGPQLAFGGTGAQMDLRAATIANRLHHMQTKNPAAFAVSLGPIKSSLHRMDEDFKRYIASDLKKTKGGEITSRYLTELLQGRTPTLTDDEKRKLRTLEDVEGGYWLNKAQ